MRTPSTADLQRNHLLCLLKPETQQRLLPLLNLVPVEIGQFILQAERPTSTVYFPLSFVSSTLKTMEDGITMEIATIGNEGFVGMPLFFGSQQEPLDSVAQIGGEALTMSAEDFNNTIDDATTGLRKLLLLYAQAEFSQVVQNAACNRAHSMEQRCARWILMTQDRVHDQSFILGHHFISYMLVVPETTVASILETFSKAKLISYVGGRIRVLDRPHLKNVSCECYGDIKREYERLLDTAL
jgi:CRP-like cAMP-binding protein